jgi:hypothetical protein
MTGVALWPSVQSAAFFSLCSDYPRGLCPYTPECGIIEATGSKDDGNANGNSQYSGH